VLGFSAVELERHPGDSNSMRQRTPCHGALGHRGQGGIAMPSVGRLVERDYADVEVAALKEGAEAAGLSLEAGLGLLGATCLDVYLNARAFWRCIPIRVRRYSLGGHPVIKKWLSYRERALLGRDLRPDEARYVPEMTRRIAAILLLEPALDENYERVKADAYDWPEGEGGV
jgi:hypothetical protein